MNTIKEVFLKLNDGGTHKMFKVELVRFSSNGWALVKIENTTRRVWLNPNQFKVQ